MKVQKPKIKKTKPASLAVGKSRGLALTHSTQMAVGALLLAVGLIGTALTMPWQDLGRVYAWMMPGSDANQLAAVGDQAQCRLVFDKCGANDTCMPVTGPEGKPIPRTCSAGERRSSTELQNKYKQVATKCKGLLATRNETLQSEAQWESYSGAFSKTMDDKKEFSWGEYINSAFQSRPSAVVGAAVDTANTAKGYAEYAEKAKLAWSAAKTSYTSAKSVGLATEAAHSAVGGSAFLAGEALDSVTDLTLGRLSKIGQEVAGTYAAAVQEADAQWQGCLNEAKAIKASEQQLLEF